MTNREDTPWGELTGYTLPNGEVLTIGMYPHPSEEHKDQRRAELRTEDGRLLTHYNYTWVDIEEELLPNAEDYGRKFMEKCNEYIEHNYHTITKEYDAIVLDYFQGIRLDGWTLVHTS